MKLYRIDGEACCYVLTCGDGHTMIGFDVADRRAKNVSAWLGESAAGAPTPGTLSHFVWYAGVMERGAKYSAATGHRCNADLIPALIHFEGDRVEVVYPDGERERFIVGRSTGWMPCHLAIKSRRSSGGSPVYFPPGTTVRVVTANARNAA